MQRIDAHQHFWKFDPQRDQWITDEMSVIRKDFLPGDLEPVLRENNFDGCVVVQSDQSEQETIFQLANAEEYDFIKGVVGWIDLQAGNISERLAHYSQFRKLKGFRHILQGEAQRDLMLQPAFLEGIRALKDLNYTYDILIFEDQMKYISDFVGRFPDQKFVLDHMGKPDIKHQTIDEWEKGLQAIALFENVYCKFSGFVTEADLQHWKTEDFVPYFDVTVDAFGMDRLMFGSDWPVCLLGSDYKTIVSVAEEYFSNFSQNEQDNFFGNNAVKFYNL